MMLPTGTALGPYRILALLGRGGMGEVYRARDTRLGRDVAVKVIATDKDHGDTRRFDQEARVAGSLNHPNVCAVFDIGTHEGAPFVVMELLEGMSLRARLQQGPIPAHKAIDWASQAARGLAAAHEKGIVHRDLKPENLFLTDDGRVKVLDFGLAKLTRYATDILHNGPTVSVSMTALGNVMGTAGYMAPEQVHGEPSDQRTDIFALGTVLYELLTGRRAFPGSTFVESSYRILSEDPPPANASGREYPAGLEAIVRRCLEKTPRERFQEASDLAFALESLLGDRTGSTVSRREGRRFTARARGRWFAVLGAAAALVLTGVMLVLRPGRDAPPAAVFTPEVSTIAVLPFQNLSGEGPNAYFAGGLHDELLTQLSKVAALTVISRTSVMGYQGTTKPLRQVADELGVGSVVEGSVQVAGGRLRVNVQLIDATSDKHIWAESYDRLLDDAFAVQSEVAQRIVAAVGATLTDDERGRITEMPSPSAEAYRFYLQGQGYFTRPGRLEPNLRMALRLFGKAVGLDQNFALAYAALSRAHGALYWYVYDQSPSRAELQRETAEAALRLKPDLAEAHMATGYAYYWGERDYSRAVEEFKIALKGLPNGADAWSAIGAVQRRLGAWEQALAAFERAQQLSPRDASLSYELGRTLLFMRRYPAAMEAFDRAQSLAPDYADALMLRVRTYVIWQGKVDTMRVALGDISREVGAADLTRASTDRAAFLFWDRNADGMLQFAKDAHVDVFTDQEAYIPCALYRAWAHRLRGDGFAARAAFDSALVFLDSVMPELSDDWRVHIARGFALAGIMRRDEAVLEVRWLRQSVVCRKDAYTCPLAAESGAKILAQVGDAESAIDEIERLLATPSLLSVHALQVDPLWDPIREHPRFKALLLKYAT